MAMNKLSFISLPEQDCIDFAHGQDILLNGNIPAVAVFRIHAILYVVLLNRAAVQCLAIF